MDKIFFSTVEAQCGALSEFIDLLINKQQGYNIAITPTPTGFNVTFGTSDEGTFELIEPNKIIVYPVTLPNGDVVWAENAEEERKILERWNKMMGEDIV